MVITFPYATPETRTFTLKEGKAWFTEYVLQIGYVSHLHIVLGPAYESISNDMLGIRGALGYFAHVQVGRNWVPGKVIRLTDPVEVKGLRPPRTKVYISPRSLKSAERWLRRINATPRSIPFG
ncbi:hypothetical protein KY386_03900 [Candidatus Parcubacteria bacterium]|nr:hypothetical protein [Candidatus Parcubacteria bacterium]